MNRINNARRAASLIVIPALVAVACSQPPNEIVQQARESEQLAIADRATDYAPEAMTEVAETRAALEAEMAVQAERWGPRRSYGEAEQLAEAYRAASQQASVEANEAQAVAHNTAETLILDSEVLLQEVRDMIEVAPTGKGSAADLAMLRGDLDAAEDGLESAQAAMLTETYLEAQAAASSAREMIDRVKAALEQARVARAG